jgi:hypothetical protein
VFQSKSWLQKQVEEAQYQQAKKIVLGIDWSEASDTFLPWVRLVTPKSAVSTLPAK